MTLKPFWRYYGGKWRAASSYPVPLYNTIVEPFAGAAGYSLRHAERRIVLVEAYPVIAEMWRYLIGVTPGELERIPIVDDVRELPSWVPDGARYLVGFHMNAATVSPCVTLSSGLRKNRLSGEDRNGGWTVATRSRIAHQVSSIRHWTVIDGDYTNAPDIEATWFVDPPYNNAAGRRYVHHEIDYTTLAVWCQNRRGQQIVCENEGARWLAFRPLGTFKAGPRHNDSKEVIWP